jgi:DNA-binding NarL/FixJ family response regulator
MSRIRVLIADDHDDVLINLMDLLRPEFDVVGAVRVRSTTERLTKALTQLFHRSTDVFYESRLRIYN